MDETRFDHLIRTLTDSRRSLLGAALGLAAGTRCAADADAKKRRKRRRKKQRPAFNQYGCVNVGGKCFGNSGNCCSGICEGTGAESRCVAHHAEDCVVSDDTCQEFTPCGPIPKGACYRTTGNAGFCGNPGLCDCSTCSKDTDCEAQFGPGSACVVCSTSEVSCVGVKGSKGTACLPPASASVPG
jgi:hypothetical protein